MTAPIVQAALARIALNEAIGEEVPPQAVVRALKLLKHPEADALITLQGVTVPISGWRKRRDHEPRGETVTLLNLISPAPPLPGVPRWPARNSTLTRVVLVLDDWVGVLQGELWICGRDEGRTEYEVRWPHVLRTLAVNCDA